MAVHYDTFLASTMLRALGLNVTERATDGLHGGELCGGTRVLDNKVRGITHHLLKLVVCDLLQHKL